MAHPLIVWPQRRELVRKCLRNEIPTLFSALYYLLSIMCRQFKNSQIYQINQTWNIWNIHRQASTIDDNSSNYQLQSIQTTCSQSISANQGSSYKITLGKGSIKKKGGKVWCGVSEGSEKTKLFFLGLKKGQKWLTKWPKNTSIFLYFPKKRPHGEGWGGGGVRGGFGKRPHFSPFFYWTLLLMINIEKMPTAHISASFEM